MGEHSALRAHVQRTHELAAALGVALDDSGAAKLCAALERAERIRDIQRAALSASKPGALVKALGQVRQLGERLVKELEKPSVRDELDARLPFEALDVATLAELIKQVVAIAAERSSELDKVSPATLGRPQDTLMSTLGAIAEEHLGISATAPGDPPAGPFVDFVQGVARLWGETPPSPLAIKSALYR